MRVGFNGVARILVRSVSGEGYREDAADHRSFTTLEGRPGFEDKLEDAARKWNFFPPATWRLPLSLTNSVQLWWLASRYVLRTDPGLASSIHQWSFSDGLAC